MKRVAIALLGLACVAMLASPASAANLLMENFSYLDGGLVAVSGGNWLTHSGTGTDVQVISGVAKGDMLAAPDDNRLLSSARSATDVTYSCMRVRIPSITGAPRTNYFAHFKNASTSFPCKLHVAPLDATFTFGISVISNTPTLWPTALNYDQWYVIATKYDAANGTATMWIDPVDESSTSLTAADVTTGITIVAYALRQSSTGTGTAWTYEVDDLGVGTAFIDACETPVPVENSTWGRIKSVYN